MSFWDLLSGLIQIYVFLLFLRIILSWFQASVSGRAWELLVRITEPYLSLFRRLRFLRRGMFDFSPLAAILSLVVVLRLIFLVQQSARISVGIVLAIVVGTLWSAARFLLVMFLILAVLRVILLAIPSTRYSRVAGGFGYMLEPVMSLVRRLFAGRQPLSDTGYLFVTIVFLAVLWLLGSFLIRMLVGILAALPI